VDGYIAGLDEINAEALQGADRLKVISRYGVGVDNVDLQAAQTLGIPVTNTPGANAVSVAELALGLILCLARNIPAAAAATRLGEWPRQSGISLEGKTVAILGLGAIGKALVRRLSSFDCRILACEPNPDWEFCERYQVEILALVPAVAQADFLSLHLPLLPETRGLVNSDFLSQVKHGAYLINTARGEIVDEAALLAALQSGHLRGAALDAFSQEPPDPANPLLTLPQVIVTPHMGAHADGATTAMGRMALDDCLAVLRGNQPKYRII
jgi:D-3-phosphoglycerate dehydrogenase